MRGVVMTPFASVAVPWATLPGVKPMNLCLFVNVPQLGPDLKKADLVQPVLLPYSPIKAVTFDPSYIDGRRNHLALSQLLRFQAGVPGDTFETMRGWFLTNQADDTVIAAGAFQQPVKFDRLGVDLAFLLRWTMEGNLVEEVQMV